MNAENLQLTRYSEKQKVKTKFNEILIIKMKNVGIEIMFSNKLQR